MDVFGNCLLLRGQVGMLRIPRLGAAGVVAAWSSGEGRITVAKSVADDRTERSLYMRANGYSHPAVKFMTVSDEHGTHIETLHYIEHYPADSRRPCKEQAPRSLARHAEHRSRCWRLSRKRSATQVNPSGSDCTHRTPRISSWKRSLLLTRCLPHRGARQVVPVPQ